MQVSSSYQGKISRCDSQRLFLVNGVTTLGKSKIVIADGGNDRVCLYDIADDTSVCIGTKGFGRYQFTEPIGVFSSDDRLYVTDWHNHRVVVYTDSLEYVTEVGHYGNHEAFGGITGKVEHVARFLRNIGHEGVYYRDHLDPENDERADGRRFSFRKLLGALGYWYERNGSITGSVSTLFDTDDFMYKPNGVVGVGDRLYVTQKDNRCITVFDVEDDYALKYQRQYDSPINGSQFGRLCNVSTGPDSDLYVCEQIGGRIYRLTPEIELVETIEGEDMGTGSFIPFSCVVPNSQFVVAGGGYEFQVINQETDEVVHRSDRMGEVHGLAYDERREELYVADRSEGCVRRYSLQFG